MRSRPFGRLSFLFGFIAVYIGFSFLVRSVLYVWSLPNLDVTPVSILKIFGIGLFFDFGEALFLSLVYLLYLLCLPSRLTGTWFDRIATYSLLSIILFLAIFGFAGEFPFWDEFSTRYNFIAVDYLIYTYEVIENIHESYPIPLILLGIFSVIGLIYYAFGKWQVAYRTFHVIMRFPQRALFTLLLFGISMLYIRFARNEQAEWSNNVYENELSKNGVFSLFAAYRSNELDYQLFYPTLAEEEADHLMQQTLRQPGQQMIPDSPDPITRMVYDTGTLQPNIILIAIESLSAEFLATFGNQTGLTPHLDTLAAHGIVYSNMYATGTRTVRGMEALTLCVPPTPGNSIVRRPDNDHLYSIGTVLRARGYRLTFLYGGDGYFDNMNAFFGGQGFEIVDRDRGNPLPEKIHTRRFVIRDQDVTFENAWGICDADIYRKSLAFADLYAKDRQPFFQFIMTTSNHKPYTFPDGKIDLEQGSREGAVKYTDFAIGEFIDSARNRPWFDNTIFVIVADHCASSAGKWEISIEKHHIPAIIYHASGVHETVDKLVSQIDLMPTLFGLLHWSYLSRFYGMDVNLWQPSDERALIGNYRTLGLLKNSVFTQIDNHKSITQYHWDARASTMEAFGTSQTDSLVKITLAYYQTASERFSQGIMREEPADASPTRYERR